MKTVEQILLNYMYRKGYAEEEMHDPNVIRTVRSSLTFCLHLLAIRVKRAAGNLNERLQRAVEQLSVQLQPIRNYFEELQQPVERKIPERPTFDARPVSRLQHQVEDRKPRHPVRKVIK